MQNNLPSIPSWDEYFMRHVYLSATKSKDPRTKIGAILVRDGRHIISEGYNGIPKGVCDCKPERFERPEKYNWFEHAERNSVYVCARYGIASDGTTMYTQGIPCINCTRAVVQAGIKELVVHKQWEDNYDSTTSSINNDIDARVNMLSEAGVVVRRYDGILNVQGFMDGKILHV